MAAVLGFLFTAIVIVAAIAAAIGLVVHHVRQRQEAWQTVANEFGLELGSRGMFSTPSMSGTVDGFGVRVQNVSVDEVAVTQYWIGYQRFQSQPMELTKAKSFNFASVQRILGTVDIEIGDEEFDRQVVINAIDAESVGAYLTPDRRQTVLYIFAQKDWRNQRVSTDSITVATEQVAGEEDVLRSVLSKLVHAAKIMRDYPAQAEALEAYEPGPLDDLVDEPLPAYQPVEEPATASETLEMSPAPIQDEPVEVALPFDQTSVMHDLFDSDRMGYETDDHFAANYANKDVEWIGEVDTVRAFSSDRDFTGAGNKVTVLLGYLRGEELRSREVKAVAQLSTGMTVERGDRITIRGRLVRADRFTNSLYVADAEIR